MFLLLINLIFLKMFDQDRPVLQQKRFTITLRGILRVFNIQLIKQVFWSSIALTLNFTPICYAPFKKINPLQNINNVILNAYLIPLIYYFLKH